MARAVALRSALHFSDPTRIWLRHPSQTIEESVALGCRPPDARSGWLDHGENAKPDSARPHGCQRASAVSHGRGDPPDARNTTTPLPPPQSDPPPVTDSAGARVKRRSFLARRATWFRSVCSGRRPVVPGQTAQLTVYLTPDVADSVSTLSRAFLHDSVLGTGFVGREIVRGAELAITSRSRGRLEIAAHLRLAASRSDSSSISTSLGSLRGPALA